MPRLGTAALLLAVLGGCGATAQDRAVPGKIVYISNSFPFKDAYGSNLGACVYEGGKTRQLRANCLHTTWAPDGTRLLYEAYLASGDGEWVIGTYPEGRVLRRFQLPHMVTRLVWATETALFYIGYKSAPGLTPPDTPENLYRYDLDTGVERQLTHFTDIGLWTGMTSFAVSPDQQTLFFSKYDHDESLPPHPAWGGKPMFDGKSAFVFRLDVATGQITRLFQGNYPRMMPDGQRLVCVLTKLNGEEVGTHDLFYYNVETQAFTRLTNNGSGNEERNPAPSPDGRYVVYEIHAFGGGEGGRGLYVINADGTHERLLVGRDGYDYKSPDWGP